MEWRVVKGFEDYAVSDTGLVMRMGHVRMVGKCGAYYIKPKLIKAIPMRKGYLQVSLYKNSKAQIRLIHRLVAEAFIVNPESKPQVNHKDGNKQNNAVSNLEWCTNSENQLHAGDNGLKKIGTEHHCCKLTLEEVRDIKSNCRVGVKGVSQLDFARKYNISLSSVRDILAGRSYRRVC